MNTTHKMPHTETQTLSTDADSRTEVGGVTIFFLLLFLAVQNNTDNKYVSLLLNRPGVARAVLQTGSS